MEEVLKKKMPQKYVPFVMKNGFQRKYALCLLNAPKLSN